MTAATRVVSQTLPRWTQQVHVQLNFFYGLSYKNHIENYAIKTIKVNFMSKPGNGGSDFTKTFTVVQHFRVLR